MSRRHRLAALALVPLAAAACAAPSAAGPAAAPAPVRIGALFPFTGMPAALAREEFRGVQIAADLVNQAGGVGGRRVELVSQDLEVAAQADTAVARLRARGVSAVIGAYSSDLSIPASAATAAAGLVYWEAGAVADRLTGRGLPLVFRVGATGSNLGANSARFAAEQVAPRLHRAVSAMRVAVVAADDDYGLSVADAATAQSRAQGMPVVATLTYDGYHPDFGPILARLRVVAPDVLILASHIPDGVAFRRAQLAAGLHLGAFIGSTMAECGPDFGDELGADAIGVFASDRPTQGFNPQALLPEGRDAYARFASAYRRDAGEDADAEALAGFSAAWALFHDVLPEAVRTGALDTAGIAAAARALDLPAGALPNGAGLRFATDAAHLGQNLAAAAVVWQWQAVRHSVTVWPAAYATGSVAMVPLPR